MRSGHTDTGATVQATGHATERGGVRQLHVYEAMGVSAGSQVSIEFRVGSV